MKRMYFVALAMGAAIVQAAAADLPQRPVYTPAPVVVPTFSWTGFYLGGNLGGAWSSTTVTSNITGANWKPSSTNFIGGGQLGYNYQFPSNWVVGIEWTFDWGGGDKTSNVVTAPNGNQLQASANGASWLTTLAGRLGYGMDRWLVYGKGGWAWLETSAQIRNLTTGAVANGDHTGSGWVAGAGVEYALTQNWTTKLEYNYIGSGNWSSPNNFIAGGTASYKAHIQTLVVGVNYKF